MIIYLQMIESDEDKSKFEQLYIMYKGLMFHVPMKILRMNLMPRMQYIRRFYPLLRI